MPCPDENALLDFARGLLGPERAASIEEHLDGCAACRVLAAEAAGAEPGEADCEPEPAGPAPMFSKLGRYLVLDLISAGGMGVVYSAFDPELDRKVALKVLRPEALGAETVADAQGRLLKEAQSMARLSHPNVVPVYDAGAVGEQVFVAMELVDGGTLAEWLTASRRGWREVLAVMLEAGRGLAAAHAAGLVHRDFKPDNVLVGRDGRVRVSDFGLARPLASEAERQRPEPSGPGAVSRSTVAGTPAYMAPERYEGRGDARSDQFSFCVALYEALHGRRPFEGADPASYAQSVRSGRLLPPPAGSKVPGWIDRTIARGLAPEPDRRFPYLEALLDALERRTRARSLGRWALAGAVAISIAGGVAAVQLGRVRGERCAAFDRELAKTWGPGRLVKLRESCEGVELPFAGASCRTLASQLDAWAREWTLLRAQACEAGDEARAGCLEHHRERVSALLEAFARPDARAVEHAVTASFAASDLSECRAGGASGRPATARDDQLGLRLAKAEAAALLGRRQHAASEAFQLSVRARELRDRWLEARAALLAGDLALAEGEAQAAEARFEDAALAAEAGGAPLDAAQAWARLSLLRGAFQLDGPAAEAAARHARAFLEAAGEPAGEVAARLRRGLAEGHLARGQGAQAAALLTEAGPEEPRELEAFEDRLDLARAAALADGAGAERALALLESAHEQGERLFGPSHPRLADLESQRGRALAQLGRHEAALAAHLAARDIWTKARGPESERLGEVLVDEARCLLSLGKPADAGERAERAAALIERAPAGPSSLAQDAHLTLGEARLAEEKPEQALAAFERAYRGADPKAPDLERAAHAMSGIGRAQGRLAQPQKARAALELALKLRESAHPRPEALARARLELAQALWDAGEAERAKALAVQARDELDAASPGAAQSKEIEAWIAGR